MPQTEPLLTSSAPQWAPGWAAALGALVGATLYVASIPSSATLYGRAPAGDRDHGRSYFHNAAEGKYFWSEYFRNKWGLPMLEYPEQGVSKMTPFGPSTEFAPYDRLC